MKFKIFEGDFIFFYETLFHHFIISLWLIANNTRGASVGGAKVVFLKIYSKNYNLIFGIRIFCALSNHGSRIGYLWLPSSFNLNTFHIFLSTVKFSLKNPTERASFDKRPFICVGKLLLRLTCTVYQEMTTWSQFWN